MPSCSAWSKVFERIMYNRVVYSIWIRYEILVYGLFLFNIEEDSADAEDNRETYVLQKRERERDNLFDIFENKGILTIFELHVSEVPRTIEVPLTIC